MRAKRVLIAEDDSDTLALYLATFKLWVTPGLPRMAAPTIDLAGDPLTARERVAENKYDLIIADLHGIDGFSLAREAERLGHVQSSQVLIVSALSSSSEMKEIEEYGFTFLSKPLSIRDLAKVISEKLHAASSS